MKHNVITTLILTALFLAAQAVGIGTAAYAHATAEDHGIGEPVGVGERPSIPAWATVAYFVVAIGISTALILTIASYGLNWVWKAWFSLATFIALYIFTSVYTSDLLAAVIAVVATGLRVAYRHTVIHNLIELAMYAGIAVFITPLFSVNAVVILLGIMSAYDIYAVNRSKHMVRLAEFTRDSELFPGLNLAPKQQPIADTSSETSSAGVLGGGDILFPMLLATTVFFAATTQTTILTATLYAGLVAIGAGGGLLTLLLISRQGRYYPALPFITTGCLIALVAVRTLHAF